MIIQGGGMEVNYAGKKRVDYFSWMELGLLTVGERDIIYGGNNI